VEDPLLPPIPQARKTLNTWREAVNLVDARSPDLRIAEAEVARAEGLSRQALGRVLPTLTAIGSINRHLILSEGVTSVCPTGGFPVTNPANPGQSFCPGGGAPILEHRPYPATTMQGQIVGRVPILAPRAWYAVGTARTGADAARSSASESRRLLLANLASAIVNVVAAERTSEINRSGLRTSLERLELTRRRSRLGAGTQLDVVRAEQDANLARTQIVQGDEALRRSREALGLALGEDVPYGVPPNITINEVQQSVMATCTLGKPEDRPDVIAAKAQLRIAERQVNEARLGFLPTAEAQTAFSVNNLPALQQANQRAYNWTIGATLTIPLYEGSRYGELKSARAVVEQQKARVEAAVRQARLDTQQSVRGVEVAQQSLAVSTAARDLARETARLTQVAYEAGTATSFELIDSAQRLRQAELDLAVRELELVRARITALLASAVCDN